MSASVRALRAYQSIFNIHARNDEQAFEDPFKFLTI